MLLLGGLVFLVAVVANSASPTNLTNVGADCTINRFNEVSSVLNRCTNIVVKNLIVDAGQTLKLFLKEGSTLTFQGTTTFAYAEWDGPMIWIKGSRITVVGASGHKIDGRGEKWWDGKGDGGRRKPQLMFIQATGGSIMKNINMYNCPHQCVGICDSDQLTITNWQVDSSAGNPVNGREVGHNTDGFDIYKSSNIILDSVVVRNQDDCICINGGSHLTFRNLWCYGGHGLSISSGMSLTDYNLNVVSDVHFEHSHVIDSRNGIHVKTIADGGKGKMSGLYFSDIEMSGISYYGINVEQNYRNNGGPSGNPNNNVPIDNMVIDGLRGTLHGPHSTKAHILCASGACKNFKWTNVNLQGNSQPNSCNYNPAGYNC